jgi:uncharacterized repeat protein (TIGR03943 family)
MNRRAQAVVMLLFGGAVVKVAVNGMYLRYVRHGLQPLLIACGLVLVAGAVMTLWYDLRSTARPGPAPDDGSDHGSEHGHGSDHGHGEPGVAWLLLLPVLALLLLAPPALGSYTAGQAGSVLTAQSSASDYAALPTVDPVPLGPLEYASRAVFDRGRSLAGRNLQLEGFLTPGPGGAPMLARIVVSCCAADGRPVKIGLSGDVPSGVAAGTWIRAVGTYTPTTATDPINGAVVPYLEVSSWQVIPTPDQPYE